MSVIGRLSDVGGGQGPGIFVRTDPRSAFFGEEPSIDAPVCSISGGDIGGARVDVRGDFMEVDLRDSEINTNVVCIVLEMASLRAKNAVVPSRLGR
jgi:hypothetical protein